MSIFDPHGYYISRKYNTAKGQILQKKPIDPPYVYDVAGNISKLKTLGYVIFRPISSNLYPSELKSYFLELPNFEHTFDSTESSYNLGYTYEDVISTFRQNYDFSIYSQINPSQINSIEFRLYSDCFQVYSNTSSFSNNITLTTSTIDSVSLQGYYSSQLYGSYWYIININDTSFGCSRTNNNSTLYKTIQSEFLCGGVNLYNTSTDINNFLQAITGQIQFPGNFLNITCYNPTSSSSLRYTISYIPVRMDILIHYNY